jgi:TolA-binding protein
VKVKAPEKQAVTVKATQQAVVGRERVTAMSARQLNLAWKYISKIDMLAVEESANVSVRTRPAGAVVYLDDLPLGRTPISMIVGPGQRELRVARSGYSTVTEQLRIEVGSKIDRSYRLMRRGERPKEPAEAEPEEVASAEETPPRIDLGQDSDAEDMSRRALSLRIQKKYDGSYQTYTKLIKHFPDTPAGRAALISRGLLLLEVFDRPHLALADFSAYLTRHKAGNHAPEATFGQALVYRRLGKKATERRILKKIIKLYPDTEQATKARERLRKMGRKRSPRRSRLPGYRR